MKPKTIPPHGRGVGDFLTQHAEEVTGVVSGFDRLRLQGTLRALYVPELFQNYLWRVGVRYKDFKPHLKMVTGRICAAADEIARCAGTAVRHVRSAATRKEDLVAESLRAHPRDEGLVAVLSALEPCRTWKIRSNRATKRLEPRLEFSKCLHLYFYFIHEQFGLMHLRLQTWFPFLVHVCLNGREWLCRQLDREGIAYHRADNCLPWIERFHPNHERFHAILPVDYYWTVAQSEFATDIMFRDRPTQNNILTDCVTEGRFISQRIFFNLVSWNESGAHLVASRRLCVRALCPRGPLSWSVFV